MFSRRSSLHPHLGQRFFLIRQNYFRDLPFFSVISLELVSFRVRSETDFPGELSLVVDSLIWRCFDVADKGRGTTLLDGGIAFIFGPDEEVTFATPGLAIDELEVVAFAEVLPVIELVNGGEVRETVATAVGTLAFVAFTNNPV